MIGTAAWRPTRVAVVANLRGRHGGQNLAAVIAANLVVNGVIG